MLEMERFRIKLHKFSYPSKRMPILVHGETRLCDVEYGDPLATRKALYQFAVYFRREFRYDFVQYSVEDDGANLDHMVAFLFYEHDWATKNTAYGGCIFRYRCNWTNVDPHWALQWIWLHPYERGRGRLTNVWGYFEEKFGNFVVEEPLSSAMKAFLDKKKGKYNHDIQEFIRSDERIPS